MRENQYRKELEERLKQIFPGCFVMRNPCTEYQGIPDLTIFYGTRWAMLEIKRSANEPFQPNQEYYIEKMNEQSFATVIYPENEEAVLASLIIHLDESWVQ